MEAGQPSRTSILVAAARAFGAREPDESVRNPDYLAGRLLGPDELQLIGNHPIVAALTGDYKTGRQHIDVGPTSNVMLARTRFIDDHVRAALAGGATQLVILGAGFDTRAYRLQDALSGKKVFEVDYGPTQQIKKRRIAEVLGQVPANVVFVEMDFKSQGLRDVLVSAGYQTGAQTVFVWEGVSMYLTEEAVRATLRTIAEASARGSCLVMDFTGRAIVEALRKMPDLPQHRYTTAWGEPWIFGFPDGKEREFYRECGLELKETMKLFGPEMRKRYLTKADRTTLGPLRRGMRGAPPQTGSVWQRFGRVLGGLVWFAMMLARRSKFYAMAYVVVPADAAGSRIS